MTLLKKYLAIFLKTQAMDPYSFTPSTKQGVYYIWTPRHKPTSLIKNFTLSTNQLKVKKKNWLLKNKNIVGHPTTYLTLQKKKDKKNKYNR